MQTPNGRNFCSQCGEALEGRTRRARYCGAKCRKRAQRERDKFRKQFDAAMKKARDSVIIVDDPGKFSWREFLDKNPDLPAPDPEPKKTWRNLWGML